MTPTLSILSLILHFGLIGDALNTLIFPSSLLSLCKEVGKTVNFGNVMVNHTIWKVEGASRDDMVKSSSGREIFTGEMDTNKKVTCDNGTCL